MILDGGFLMVHRYGSPQLPVWDLQHSYQSLSFTFLKPIVKDILPGWI
jgi:hypothetical protein